MIRFVFREALEVELPAPFPRMTYAEAMRRYGSDKPDLRVALELVDHTVYGIVVPAADVNSFEIQVGLGAGPAQGRRRG